MEQLQSLISQQRLFKDDFPAMCMAITETLAVDVRSKRQVQYAQRHDNRCSQPFDEVTVEYTVSDQAPEGTAEEVVVTAVWPFTPATDLPEPNVPSMDRHECNGTSDL
eukprot:GGOE01020604.1.p2 GENE.GGOE01020604.1~~GGOE01020604.1.p2  ORF type:complete len:108 (+),score=26.06 GGOE01020604.1:779-1102(+)